MKMNVTNVKSKALTLSHVPVTVVVNKYLPNSHLTTEGLMQAFTHTVLNRLANGLEMTPSDIEGFLNDYFCTVDGVRKSLLIIELQHILIEHVRAITDFNNNNISSRGYSWGVNKFVTTWEVIDV